MIIPRPFYSFILFIHSLQCVDGYYGQKAAQSIPSHHKGNKKRCICLTIICIFVARIFLCHFVLYFSLWILFCFCIPFRQRLDVREYGNQWIVVCFYILYFYVISYHILFFIAVVILAAFYKIKDSVFHFFWNHLASMFNIMEQVFYIFIIHSLTVFLLICGYWDDDFIFFAPFYYGKGCIIFYFILFFINYQCILFIIVSVIVNQSKKRKEEERKPI